jgi:integrase
MTDFRSGFASAPQNQTNRKSRTSVGRTSAPILDDHRQLRSTEMPGKQAQRVTPPMLKRTLRHVARSALARRDKTMILLSVKAGLRACEVARLDWSMVLDARGKVADTLSVHDAIAKKRAGRRIPIHTDLRCALQSLLRQGDAAGPVIQSARGGHLRPNSIVNWFVALFAELGFEGCSSHSGRRTFITATARNIHRSGCSLRDV